MLIACFQLAFTASLVHDHDDVNETNGQKLATAEKEEVSLDNVLKTVRTTAQQAEEKFEVLKYDFFLSQIENTKENKHNFVEDSDKKYEQRPHRRVRRERDPVFELRQKLMLMDIRRKCGNKAECTMLSNCIQGVKETGNQGLHRCCQLYKCDTCNIICEDRLYGAGARLGLEQKPWESRR